MRIFHGITELAAASGAQLGTSDWVEVDQNTIDTFARATGDHQWIHVDPERAASGPFGSTIAHGLLTLALLPRLLGQLFEVEDAPMRVNYGLNKVRFPAPVPVGSKIRATAEITEAVEIDGAVQVTFLTVMDAEHGGKPVCVVESVMRVYA